jgi:hypothetical protein
LLSSSHVISLGCLTMWLDFANGIISDDPYCWQSAPLWIRRTSSEFSGVAWGGCSDVAGWRIKQWSPSFQEAVALLFIGFRNSVALNGATKAPSGVRYLNSRISDRIWRWHYPSQCVVCRWEFSIVQKKWGLDFQRKLHGSWGIQSIEWWFGGPLDIPLFWFHAKFRTLGCDGSSDLEHRQVVRFALHIGPESRRSLSGLLGPKSAL